jgi:hypothetical protein
MKHLFHHRSSFKNEKTSHILGKKYLQAMNLKMNLYLEYTKNSQTSTTITKNLIQKWAKDMNRLFFKRICRWKIST